MIDKKIIYLKVRYAESDKIFYLPFSEAKRLKNHQKIIIFRKPVFLVEIEDDEEKDIFAPVDHLLILEVHKQKKSYSSFRGEDEFYQKCTDLQFWKRIKSTPMSIWAHVFRLHNEGYTVDEAIKLCVAEKHRTHSREIFIQKGEDDE